MRLKKVELSGFKSFLDRTKLVFQPGISAVVGPNGCGKSNVVDAVLWVMGEQSAKSLRCESAMENVIFGGTESREQVGMAEVNLILDNSNGDAPTQYSEHTEIMVTRRLYRTGESEYLINKTPCRLRDIIELFLDTGVGTKAYSIIKQGQIERITGAKPEELRSFIEEAAGISKYKARKKAAERKMQSTKDNLSRVEDIISEISRQLDSLNRQARKAQRYKDYKEELRSLDLELASHNLAELREELNRRETGLREVKDKESDAENEIEAREADLETAKANLLELEKEIENSSQQQFRIQSELQEAENRVEVMTDRINSITDSRQKAETEIKDITGQVESIETELEELENSHKTLTMEVASNDADLQVRANELSEIRERMEAIRRSHEDSLSQQASIKASVDGLKQAIAERREQMDNYESRLSEKKIAKSMLAEELEKLKQLSFDFSRDLDQMQKSKDELEKKLESEVTRLENMKEEYSEKEVLLESLRTEYNQRLSRFDSLRELEANLEGYNEGVRSIMLEKEEKEGIYGMVADVISTSPQYEKALESVLGERLQHIIVRGHEEGMEAIDYLKSRANGRGTFIPVGVNSRTPSPSPEIEDNRVLGEMMNLVAVDDQYQRVAEHLLGDVLVVTDMQAAVDMLNSNGNRKTMVTLDGEVLDFAGVMTGGSVEGSGILKKKREMKELEEAIEKLSGKVEDASRECSSLESRINETEKWIEETKNTRHKREMEILQQEKEIEKYNNDTERIHRDLNQLAEDESSLVREAERCARKISELEEDLRTKQARLEDLDKVIEKSSETLRVFQEDISSRESAITNLKIDHATSCEKLESLEKRRTELADRREELIERRREKMAEIARGAEDVSRLEKEIETKKQQLEDMHSTRMEIEQKLAEQRDNHQKLLAHQNQLEENLKEKRRNVEEIRRQMNELRVAYNEYSLKIEHLVGDVQDKYDEDLLEIGPKFIDSEDLRDEKRQRRNRLRELIGRMGEVNLTAIKEYEELKERYDFLTSQRDDLVKSIEDLQSVIRKINRTSRKRFSETFELVDRNFRNIFPRLFGGGRARLVLEDAQDILDAGVQIEGQPPGKKLQNMSLLSGGEKALAAVALIFSLFLVKPSPFCVLDEVDSPLDDVNIDRFNDLIRELSKNSQFIIITHNKRTMELADTLYGVTMEEKGISKLVTVRLAGSQNSSEEAA